MINKIITIFYLIIGLYAVYTGFKGEGKLYENPTIREDKREAFKKDMSLFLKTSGAFLSVGSVLELLDKYPYVYIACYMEVIVSALILSFRMRKYKRKQI